MSSPFSPGFPRRKGMMRTYGKFKQRMVKVDLFDSPEDIFSCESEESGHSKWSTAEKPTQQQSGSAARQIWDKQHSLSNPKLGTSSFFDSINGEKENLFDSAASEDSMHVKKENADDKHSTPFQSRNIHDEARGQQNSLERNFFQTVHNAPTPILFGKPCMQDHQIPDPASDSDSQGSSFHTPEESHPSPRHSIPLKDSLSPKILLTPILFDDTDVRSYFSSSNNSCPSKDSSALSSMSNSREHMHADSPQGRGSVGLFQEHSSGKPLRRKYVHKSISIVEDGFRDRSPLCKKFSPIVRRRSLSNIVEYSKEAESNSTQNDCNTTGDSRSLHLSDFQSQGSETNIEPASPEYMDAHDSPEIHSVDCSSERYTSPTKINCAIDHTGKSQGVQDCRVMLERICLQPGRQHVNLMDSPFCRQFGLQRRVQDQSRDLSATNASILRSPMAYCTPLSRGRAQMSFVEALTPAPLGRQKTLSAREKFFLHCEQPHPVSFTDFFTSGSLKKCVKVGEGLYGEVFRTQTDDNRDVVLKIIPIEGDLMVNCEEQKSFEYILTEVVISRELSALGDLKISDSMGYDGLNAAPGFIRVHRVHCCQGTYPKKLLTEWDTWNKKNLSENDRPDRFPADQLFLVFEFADGGRDLEHFEFDDLSQAKSVISQVALSLAVAEQALEFEHRDLHWGNILLKPTDQPLVSFALNGQIHDVESSNVAVSLIDFTLSRLQKDGLTVFCNLSEDDTMFTGKGDMQFDVYRKMRKANGNDWERFEPSSNVLWIQYLTDKLIKKKGYKHQNKGLMRELKQFFRRTTSYSSASELISDEFLL